MFEAGEIVAILLVVAVASFVTKLSGFGFGLITVPLLSLFIGPRDAVIISTLAGVMTSLNQAWTERKHADTRTVRRLFGAACAGMPLGLLVFVAVPERGLRIVLGVVVVGAAGVLARGFTLSRASLAADLSLGFVSGVLNTSVSTNGPPLVFLLHARRFPPHEFRGTISRVFFYSNLVSVTLFAIAGKVSGPAAAMAAVSLPAMYLMQWVGGMVSRHVDGERFRILVLALLFLSGLSAAVAAVRG